MSGHGHGGYERTDATAKPLIVFTVVLVVFTVSCFIAGFIVFRLLEKGRSMIDPGLHPMAVERSIQDGSPRLQVAEAADLAVYQKTMDEKVNSFGWISREASVARVPVTKAIDLILANKELKSRE